MQTSKKCSQLMLSAEIDAILSHSDEIVIENIFYKYKLNQIFNKKISKIHNNFYDKEVFDNEISFQKEKYFEFTQIIASNLNKYHKVKNTTLYWERIIGLFVLMHLHHTRYIYNFLKNLKDARFSINLLNRKCFITPETTEEYRSIVQYSYFGYEQLVSEYFYLFKKNHKFHLYQYNKQYKHKISYVKPDVSLIQRIKSKSIGELITSILLKISNYFFKKNVKSKVLLLETIFNPSKYLSLLFKSFGRIQIINNYSIVHASQDVDLETRKKLFEDENNQLDSYDKFFFHTLNLLMPKSWLENYTIRKKMAQNLLDNNNDLKYVISETLLETAHLLLSEAKERNIKYIFNEHNWLQHQYVGNKIWYLSRLCDKYLSLGWSSKDNKKILPAGSLFTWIRPNNFEDIPILYVTSLCMSKMTHLDSSHGESGSANISTYIDMNINFFDSLDDDILNKIYFRSHPHSTSPNYEENSLKDELVFSKYVNKFLYVDTKRSIKADKLMSRSKIIIINYLSSAWLQALVFNKPTIILWNKSAYRLDDNYSNFFEELMKVNIVHNDPKKAAKFLKSILHNPYNWWNDRKTINARKNFLSQNFMTNQILEKILLNYAK